MWCKAVTYCQSLCVCVIGVLCACSVDIVSTDASPKVPRQLYKKAPAPPPPPSTNQHAASQQLIPANKTTAGHQRTHSGSAVAVVASPYERPSVPPPAPPKRPDKPNITSRGETLKPADAATVFASSETSDGTKSENSDLSADYDLGLGGAQSVNTSGVSDVVELSWNSESSFAAGTQPKEDIRKMTAQLKAQWWQNSAALGDQAASKMTTEMGGKFNARISPNEPYYDSRLEGKLEKRRSENDVSVSHMERKSDDSGENLETPEAQPDVMDTNPDDTADKLDSDVDGSDALKTIVKVTVSNADANTDRPDVGTDPVFSRESPESNVNVDSDAGLRREDDVMTGVDVTDDVSHEVEEDVRSANVGGKPGVEIPDVTDLSDASSVKEGGGKSELHLARKPLPRVDVQVNVDEVMLRSPTSPAPPTRPKPLRSPPVRPPPCVSPTDVHRSETYPRPAPRKPIDSKPSASDKPSAASDSPVEPPVSPDAPRTKTLDRVRPEKPPPPLPKSSRSRTSDVVVESLAGVDCSDNAVFSDDVASHDENTHL